MSKYKERAEEIANECYNMDRDEDGNPVYYKWSVVEAMCQLAEEVEISTILTEKAKKVGKMDGIYLKEQVEELLQKQRELCANNATNDEVESNIGSYCVINKDSILNVKLKID